MALTCADDKFRADIKAKALKALTRSFLKKHPSYSHAVQSLLFDSLLARGQKSQLNFFGRAIRIASHYASRTKDTIFTGIEDAAESVAQYEHAKKHKGSSAKKGKQRNVEAEEEEQDDEEEEQAESNAVAEQSPLVESAVKWNVLVINALAKNVHAKPDTFCPLLVSFVKKRDQGKLLALLVLNKALALDKKESHDARRKRTQIRQVLFTILREHCALADLLWGGGATQEASRFHLDLLDTLESGVPSRDLFVHFVLASRPYFCAAGQTEAEKRQAEHALYLFCLHNITDSFAAKPNEDEVRFYFKF